MIFSNKFNLKKEVSRRKLTKHISKNGTICYFIDKSNYPLKEGQMLLAFQFHCIYAPINNRDYAYFIEEQGIVPHKNFTDFYKKYNGLNLFSGTFCIYGFGKEYSDGHYLFNRDPDSDILLPFDLKVNGDTYFKNGIIHIGSICDIPIIYDNNTGKLSYATDKRNFEWNNFFDCIEEVYKILDDKYFDNGFAKEPSILDDIYVFNSPKEL